MPATSPYRYGSLLKPLLIGLAALLFALAFAHLGSEIVEGETLSFDKALLLRAQALRLGHPWLAGAMRDLSGLGSTIVLALFTLITTFYLAIVSTRAMAGLVAGSVMAGALVVELFKAGFGRLRPDAVFAELVAPGLSFPSGHASISAIVFLTLGTLLASSRARLAERFYVMAVAALMTLLVGLSRVALGVHWATDVLGGWAFGCAWALVWLLVSRRVGPH